MKIVICGGHHNSALLVAKALIKKKYQVFWFGHKLTMLGDKNPSAEYLEVTKEKIPFYEIKAGKWQPKYKFIPNLARIPFGFIQSFYYLVKIRPDKIVSFGGYLALPITISGWLLGIPIITHEQTTVFGLANQIIAFFAKKVLVSFPTSLKSFPVKKVVLTGLPIRTEIFDQGKNLFNNQKKTIYITGGKQGAHIFNQEVFKILPQLLEKFNVIHQCGSTSLYHDIDKANDIKKTLKNKENYLVAPYFFEDQIGSIFKTADFVISRSGAHTIYELLYLEKPAILIPIPWSSKNEQQLNAQMLQEAGLGKILTQNDLENGLLWSTIVDFDQNFLQYKKKKNFSLEKNSVEKIIKEISLI